MPLVIGNCILRPIAEFWISYIIDKTQKNNSFYQRDKNKIETLDTFATYGKSAGKWKKMGKGI